jgi:hypothetical protein
MAGKRYEQYRSGNVEPMKPKINTVKQAVMSG